MSFDTRAADELEFFQNNDPEIELVGPYKKVPIWRTVDFWMGGVNSKGMLSTTKRSNWRTFKNPSGLDFSSSPVNENVLLIPSSKELKFTGGINLKDFSQNLGKAADFLEILTQAQEIFSGSRVVPIWKPRVLESLKELTMGGDFEFNFNFGEAGLYDAFEEVVKPVYALLNFFGVETFNNGITANVSTLDTPYPTSTEFIATQIKEGFSALINGIDTSDASVLSKLNSTLQNSIQAGAGAVARSSSYHNLWVSWGRFTFGPMTYSDIEYSFTMDNFDSYGWPLKGKFKLGGVKSMRMSTTSTLTSTIITGR